MTLPELKLWVIGWQSNCGEIQVLHDALEKMVATEIFLHENEPKLEERLEDIPVINERRALNRGGPELAMKIANEISRNFVHMTPLQEQTAKFIGDKYDR